MAWTPEGKQHICLRRPCGGAGPVAPCEAAKALVEKWDDSCLSGAPLTTTIALEVPATPVYLSHVLTSTNVLVAQGGARPDATVRHENGPNRNPNLSNLYLIIGFC